MIKIVTINISKIDYRIKDQQVSFIQQDNTEWVCWHRNSKMYLE